MGLCYRPARVTRSLRFSQLPYSATVLQIFTAVRYMRDTQIYTSAYKSLVYSSHIRLYDSVIHLYSMYFQRIGGRRRLTLLSFPNSRRLHAPLTVVPTSHLYLHGRGQRTSNAGLTPHPSASGSCQYFTHPNIHRFLHLPRSLVYIYSRPKSVFDRVT